MISPNLTRSEVLRRFFGAHRPDLGKLPQIYKQRKSSIQDLKWIPKNLKTWNHMKSIEKSTWSMDYHCQHFISLTDIFFSEYKWHIWVNLRQVNQNLVLSLQWSCWPEVWSWSLARVLTLCQPLWDGVVQCFPMTFLRPPHRYVCKLQTYVCKTRSQKRKGLIICKKMNQTWSFKYSDLLIAHDFLPFSQAELWAEESRCSVWPASRGWGSSAGSLSSLPNFFFAAEKRLITRGSCGNCMAMLNILDIEIYRFTINRFRAFALRYQQALRDLQNCSGAQILVVGRWELPWR